MKVLDAGHTYALDRLDSPGEEVLNFVKRCGQGYPGNVGVHAGTNMQEVLRALIDRVKYLNQQIPSPANRDAIEGMRDALYALEVRAAQRHGRVVPEYSEEFEYIPTCQVCGHVECASSCVAESEKGTNQ